MSNIAIEMHDLGKKYRIASLAERDDTLATILLRSVTDPVRRIRGILSGNQAAAADLDQEFWALRHVDLQIPHGEVLGVIGRNGAGKSTLLKLLSRITEPSEGYARINGRVGSLLEVGTGFHMELTGRENVYLNGSILGMQQAEISHKFDDIVQFAGVEQFIDTPVKHYSSGMQVRLAFAVAAHLDPEILLIDEVLAVGDFAFQRKSLGKMQDVTRGGRTVVFVSHQLDMVRAICDRVVLMQDGQIVQVGDPDTVIDAYTDRYSAGDDLATFTCDDEPERPYQLLAGRVLNGQGDIASHFDVYEPITIELDYVIREPQTGVNLRLNLYQNGDPLLTTFDNDRAPERLQMRPAGTYRTRMTIPAPLLKESHYTLIATIGIVNNPNKATIHQVRDALGFDVRLLSRDSSSSSAAPKRPGKIATDFEWTIRQLDPQPRS